MDPTLFPSETCNTTRFLVLKFLQDLKFVQVELKDCLTLAVMTRLKRDYVTFSKRPSKMASSCDHRITLTVCRDTFYRKEHILLQVFRQISWCQLTCTCRHIHNVFLIKCVLTRSRKRLLKLLFCRKHTNKYYTYIKEKKRQYRIIYCQLRERIYFYFWIYGEKNAMWSLVYFMVQESCVSHTNFCIFWNIRYMKICWLVLL